MTVDGAVHRTSLRTTLAGLRQLRPVDLVLCDGTSTGSLSDGEHRFLARSTDAFTVSAATLTRPGASTGPGGRPAVDVQRWDREDRAVRVGTRNEPALLVVPESVNPGWVATLDGVALQSRTVDGWQQGYVLPAGPAGVVTLEFRAGGVYHAALAAGAAAVLVLFAVLLVPGRRTVPPAGATVPAGRRRRLVGGRGARGRHRAGRRDQPGWRRWPPRSCWPGSPGAAGSPCSGCSSRCHSAPRGSSSCWPRGAPRRP